MEKPSFTSNQLALLMAVVILISIGGFFFGMHAAHAATIDQQPDATFSVVATSTTPYLTPNPMYAITLPAFTTASSTFYLSFTAQISATGQPNNQVWVVCATSNCAGGTYMLFGGNAYDNFYDCMPQTDGNYALTTYTCPAHIQAGGSAGTYYIGVNNSYAIASQVTYASDFAGNPYFVLTDTGSPIDWYSITAPIPFTLASTTAITASSSLWGSLLLASTSVSCVSGDWVQNEVCAAVSYLLLPNPNIITGFTQLPTVVGQKFPFSWFFGMQQTVSTLSASGTANMANITIDLTPSESASSTAFGQLVPPITVLSSTTISTDLSPSLLSLLLELETFAIWILFAVYIIRDGRSWLHH